MVVKLPLVPAASLCAALMFAACAKKEETVQKAPEVIVARPVVKKIASQNEYTTRIEAKDSVEVRARVTGYLNEILFKDGDMVKKDDVLFVIDPRPFQAELDKAQGKLKEAESKLELASANSKRAAQLFKDNVISRVEYEKYTTDGQAAAAEVQAARGAVDAAQLNLKFSRVTAPFAGKVSKGAFSSGNLVEAGKAVLTTIVTLDPVQASFDIDERALLEARRATIARGGAVGSGTNSLTIGLVLSDGGQYPRGGKIDFIDNQINPTTGTLRARAVFPNPDLLLTPGMFARVRVGGEETEAILIPERAIGTDQDQKFVYVVNDQNVAEFRKITLGPMAEGLRVVADGLAPGDRVVVDGLLRVRPGSPVQPREAGAGPAPAAEPKKPAGH